MEQQGRRGLLRIGAALILSSGCGGAGNESERASAEPECRGRLAEASGPGFPAGADNPVAGAFRAAAERLAAMSREGCSAEQRSAADRMKAAAERVAAQADRAGLRGFEPPPPGDARRTEAFIALQAELEAYERRRAALLR